MSATPNTLLSERRKHIGLAQAQVSRNLGRAVNYCLRLEKGEAIPSPENLRELMSILEVETPEQIGYTTLPSITVRQLAA